MNVEQTVSGLVKLIRSHKFSPTEAAKIYESFENRYFIKHHTEYLVAYNSKQLKEYDAKESQVWQRYVSMRIQNDKP